MKGAIIAMVAPSLPVVSRNTATNGCTVAVASTSLTSPIVKARVTTTKSDRVAFDASATINDSGTTLEAFRTFSTGKSVSGGMHQIVCLCHSLMCTEQSNPANVFKA
jgi:hypothetical protein